MDNYCMYCTVQYMYVHVWEKWQINNNNNNNYMYDDEDYILEIQTR